MIPPAPSLFAALRRDWYELTTAILRADPAAKSPWEVRVFYPGFRAILLHRIAHHLYVNGHTFWARGVSDWSRWITGIEIHPGAQLGQRVFIDHGMGVVIGETAVVEDDVTLYQMVTLGGVSLAKGIKRHPTIERGAIIGAGASVLGDITIGEGSRVGSGSVVVDSVPPHATVVGIPGKIIGHSKAPRSKGHTPSPSHPPAHHFEI